MKKLKSLLEQKEVIKESKISDVESGVSPWIEDAAEVDINIVNLFTNQSFKIKEKPGPFIKKLNDDNKNGIDTPGDKMEAYERKIKKEIAKAIKPIVDKFESDLKAAVQKTFKSWNK